jgi:transposase
MKRDGRSLAHNTLEEMRILAVQRMAEGEHPNDVAASFGMHRSWAYKVRAQARGRGRGVRALRSTKGTGRHRKLMRAQEQRVLRWINGKNPMQYGFDFGLWTRNLVRELVQREFAITLSLASIGTMLARLNLTPQKPLQRAYQRDPAAIERWQHDRYPAIAGQARDENADIFFWDESGFRADSVHGRTSHSNCLVDQGRNRRRLLLVVAEVAQILVRVSHPKCSVRPFGAQLALGSFPSVSA